MIAKRQRAPAGATTRNDSMLPVVVTLNANDELVDVVGDFESFVAEGDTTDAVVSRLAMLAYGDGGLPERLGAVEVSDNHFADINMFLEDEFRHFVLRDVSAAMRSLRARQQLGHEAELEQWRIAKPADRKVHGGTGALPRADRVFRQGPGLFEMVSADMRESLLLLTGHVQVLARQLQGNPAMLASVAAMQHAVMRLDALSSNAMIGLGEMTTGKDQRGTISLDGLAGFLQDSFALQASMRGITLELRIPEKPVLIEVDDLALRRLLVNLIVHALDGMDRGELRVQLRAKDGELEIELEAEPGGLSVTRFGELVTTVDLLHSNAHGNLLLAASQTLLQRLNADIELVERIEGGHLLWVRIPVIIGAAEATDSATTRPRDDALDARLVAVSLADRALAQRVIATLRAEGIPAVEIGTLGRIKALARNGDLRAAVVADNGQDVAALVGHPMLVVAASDDGRDDDGWTHDGGVIRVSTTIGDEALREALDTMLIG